MAMMKEKEQVMERSDRAECCCSGTAIAGSGRSSRVGAPLENGAQALEWAAGGRQVQGKINAICKVPSTQSERWIVSSSDSEGTEKSQQQMHLSMLFGDSQELLVEQD
ncbi:unnamed protein product [Pleuronectes platessa]|uniref:Uncharacterized protein n=1 Tax=Pleuronectes platessa TaxID=8262 RepID=A0A9N7YNG3_PLEPL|nr:unnamed protein product [Pleuronectes platessa]